MPWTSKLFTVLEVPGVKSLLPEYITLWFPDTLDESEIITAPEPIAKASLDSVNVR